MDSIHDVLLSGPGSTPEIGSPPLFEVRMLPPPLPILLGKVQIAPMIVSHPNLLMLEDIFMLSDPSRYLSLIVGPGAVAVKTGSGLHLDNVPIPNFRRPRRDLQLVCYNKIICCLYYFYGPYGVYMKY